MSAITDYLETKIQVTKDMIDAYEAAIDFLIANPTESYRLDTGQSTQEVKRHNLNNLQAALDGLYNRLVTLEARLYGAGVAHVIPGW